MVLGYFVQGTAVEFAALRYLPWVTTTNEALPARIRSRRRLSSGVHTKSNPSSFNATPLISKTFGYRRVTPTRAIDSAAGTALRTRLLLLRYAIGSA